MYELMEIIEVNEKIIEKWRANKNRDILRFSFINMEP